MLCVNQFLLKVDFSLQVQVVFQRQSTCVTHRFAPPLLKISVNNPKSDTVEVGKVKQI